MSRKGRKVGIHTNNFHSMLQALKEALDDETYKLVERIIYRFITHYL